MIPAQFDRASPEWLVSVRNIAEASTVIRFGVDVIDWKEPRRGALAPVSVPMMKQAAQWWEETQHRRLQDPSTSLNTIHLSAALGEPDQACRIASDVPQAFSFAKSGPSGLRTHLALKSHWSRLAESLPDTVELVAVAYADYDRANTLRPEDILELAIEFGLHRVLIDTFEKRSGSTLDLLGWDRLSDFAHRVRSADRWWSLAGSLSLRCVLELDNAGEGVGWMPDCFAVRGAICDGQRTDTVCEDRLVEWEQYFHHRQARR